VPALYESIAVMKHRGYLDTKTRRMATRKQKKGYCTDIFTEHAIQFIEASDERPFFIFSPPLTV